MRSRPLAEALRDIGDNISLARSFAAGLSFDDFRADKRTVYAITRCLEIISEASRRLSNDLKARHPAIPWRDIAGAGSVYRHDYEALSDRFLWHTVQETLEPLRVAVEQELGRLESHE
jgi:uncharacterized protein with HEPN domain